MTCENPFFGKINARKKPFYFCHSFWRPCIIYTVYYRCGITWFLHFLLSVNRISLIWSPGHSGEWSLSGQDVSSLRQWNLLWLYIIIIYYIYNKRSRSIDWFSTKYYIILYYFILYLIFWLFVAVISIPTPTNSLSVAEA